MKNIQLKVHLTASVTITACIDAEHVLLDSQTS